LTRIKSYPKMKNLYSNEMNLLKHHALQLRFLVAKETLIEKRDNEETKTSKKIIVLIITKNKRFGLHLATTVNDAFDSV